MANNKIITTTPTLTASSNNTSDASGLYKSTATNSGKPTYYFRGNVENNYVSFAGFIWRIVRINEDGTIRIIMQDGINNNNEYAFNPNCNNYTSMYYTNSNAKTQLESWYQSNIENNTNLASKVVSGNYFCEQAKVAYNSIYASASRADMALPSYYMPNFKCTTDKNGKGVVNANIGLLTYDEVVYAGGAHLNSNNDYYLYNGMIYWTMSPAGFSGSLALEWRIIETGSVNNGDVNYARNLRPIIILSGDTMTVGNGTISNTFVIV